MPAPPRTEREDHTTTVAAPQTWGFNAADEDMASDQTRSVLIIEPLEVNRQLLRGILRPDGYHLFEAEKPTDAMEILKSEDVDLVILELMMPGMDGPEFCRRLKADRRTRLIPLLILTSVQGRENEIAGITSGADEFLVKPLHPDIVRVRVRAMLRHKAALDSREEAETLLFALAQAIERRDKAIIGHCERLAILSMTLGTALELPRRDIVALYRGGYLHDIGKVAVPDAILFKRGPLTPEEWRIMKMHTIVGEQICRSARTLAPVLPIIRHHHERWDGSGYPDGLSGERIPLLARILQVADVFDALVSKRPYKPALSAETALSVLEEEARRGWRDPALVALLRRVLNQAGRYGLPTSVPWPPSSTPMQQSLEAMRRALANK
ncbi:MAG: HD-GYP domain-containing protein [bacterium]